MSNPLEGCLFPDCKWRKPYPTPTLYFSITGFKLSAATLYYGIPTVLRTCYELDNFFFIISILSLNVIFGNNKCENQNCLYT